MKGWEKITTGATSLDLAWELYVKDSRAWVPETPLKQRSPTSPVPLTPGLLHEREKKNGFSHLDFSLGSLCYISFA